MRNRVRFWYSINLKLINILVETFYNFKLNNSQTYWRFYYSRHITTHLWRSAFWLFLASYEWVNAYILFAVCCVCHKYLLANINQNVWQQIYFPINILSLCCVCCISSIFFEMVLFFFSAMNTLSYLI